MEKIKAMVDAVVAADTLADRQTTAKNLLVAIEAKFKVSLTEAKNHIEKASAAPVPDADAPVFKGGPQAPPVPAATETVIPPAVPVATGTEAGNPPATLPVAIDDTSNQARITDSWLGSADQSAPLVPVVAEAIPVGFMGTPLGPAPIVALSAANKPVPENL